MHKTRDERIAELLEKDVAGAIKGPSLSTLADDDLKEPKTDEPDAEEEETSTGGKKVRIPVSRLKTLTSKVSELEAKLQESMTYAERVTALEAQLNNKGEDELPDWWKEAYGDTDVSKQGYRNQQRIMREEMQRAMADQEAARMAQEAEETARKEAVENSFDEQMTELQETIGRELTDNQMSEIMDIVGRGSPMENGKYTGYMPISVAYEFWQQGSGKNPAKEEMARIAGTSSSGNTSTQSSERPQWGDWRKKFNL